jgi:hypothetical protein
VRVARLETTEAASGQGVGSVDGSIRTLVAAAGQELAKVKHAMEDMELRMERAEQVRGEHACFVWNMPRLFAALLLGPLEPLRTYVLRLYACMYVMYLYQAIVDTIAMNFIHVCMYVCMYALSYTVKYFVQTSACHVRL